MNSYKSHMLKGAMIGFFVSAGITIALEIIRFMGIYFSRNGTLSFVLNMYPLIFNYYIPWINPGLWFGFQFVLIGALIGMFSNFLEKKFPKLSR